MNAYQDHAAMLDQLQVEQNDGTLFAQWNGQAVAILPGSAKFSRINARGGFDLDCDLKLTCTTKQFGGAPPNAGDQLSYLGNNYTIRDVETPPEANQIRINCLLTNAEK
jgi:hypothetical protein